MKVLREEGSKKIYGFYYNQKYAIVECEEFIPKELLNQIRGYDEVSILKEHGYNIKEDSRTTFQEFLSFENGKSSRIEERFVIGQDNDSTIGFAFDSLKLTTERYYDYVMHTGRSKKNYVDDKTLWRIERERLVQALSHPRATPEEIIKVKDNIKYFDKLLSSGEEGKTEDMSLELTNTNARQVLIMHYLLKCLNVDASYKKKTELIQFLTGRHHKTIYDAIRNPLATDDGNFRREDLQAIRPYFENLGLEEIVKMINNELEIH